MPTRVNAEVFATAVGIVRVDRGGVPCGSSARSCDATLTAHPPSHRLSSAGHAGDHRDPIGVKWARLLRGVRNRPTTGRVPQLCPVDSPLPPAGMPAVHRPTDRLQRTAGLVQLSLSERAL